MAKALFFIAIFLFASTCQQVSVADELTEPDYKCIEWFDSLDFPDLSEPPLVKVATGRWSGSGDAVKNHFVTGFLIDQTGDKFTVFGFDGKRLTFTRTPEGTPPQKAVSFTEDNIDEVVAGRIKEIMNRDPDARFSRFGATTSESFELVILARACAAKGRHRQAHKLLTLARRIKGDGRQGDRQMTLLEYLNKDQAHTRMWRAVVAFGDSRKSLEELLQQFEFIMKRFPETKHFERAKETATMLKRLIQEDKDHSEKNVPALDKLKGDQRVAELIHQLCTQNGHQWGQPGACDIFSDQRGEKSPAHLLVAEGFDAVPQLIEALDDDRFTRSVGYHRNFYFSHHVLRVADCSERILSRIAGRGFYQRKHTNGAMAKDGESDTTKGRIEAWWSDVQSKGEKQVLIDAVKLGDSNSGRQAKALVEKYPDEAVEAIRIGLAKAEGWQQQSMIGWLSKLKDDSATELLKDQLTNASTLGGRIAAARQLVPRDGAKKLALDAMVKEWLNYKSADAESGLYLNPKIKLAQFLLTSESTEGIQAVAKTFETLDTNAQCSALNALVDLATVSDESHEALEKFLVECLLITGEQVTSGTWHGQSFSYMRVCDLAGFALTRNWPDKYACRLDGTERDRDKSRFAAHNRWREDHGLEPIDFPPPFEVIPIAEEKTDPLIDQIVASKSIEQGKTAFAQLAGMGPGAIQAVQKLSRQIEDSHPFADQAKQLRIDMPNTITVLNFDTKPANLSSDWQERIDSLEGRVFTSQLIAEQLVEFAKERPCAGIRIKAARDGEGNGVQVQIELTGGSPTGRVQDSWRTNQSVWLGSKPLTSSGGGVSFEHLTSSDGLKDLKKHLDTAIGQPDEAMRVSVLLEK